MPSYTDEEFLDAFTGDQLTTTHVIADRVGCHPTTANRRLKQLADENKVEFMGGYPSFVDQTSQDLLVHRTGDENDAILPEALE